MEADAPPKLPKAVKVGLERTARRECAKRTKRLAQNTRFDYSRSFLLGDNQRLGCLLLCFHNLDLIHAAGQLGQRYLDLRLLELILIDYSTQIIVNPYRFRARLAEIDIYEAVGRIGEYLGEIGSVNLADIAGRIGETYRILAAVAVGNCYLITAVGGSVVAAAVCAADYRAIERPNIRTVTCGSLKRGVILADAHAWVWIYCQIQRNCAIATRCISADLGISAATCVRRAVERETCAR